MKRVLVLIHFASKLSREQMTAAGERVAPIVRSHLGDFAGIFTSDIAFGCVGTTNKPIDELARSLIKDVGIKSGDNLSVFELAYTLISTHPGLMQWHGQTELLAGLAESARRK